MTDENANNPAVGYSLGHYRMLKLLGAGGMGEVYLAEDARLRRKIALKVLPKNIAQDKDRLRRFEQEAFTASGLNHPNILTIYEFGLSGDVHFLAAEFVEGETLRERMEREPLSLREVLDVATQVAAALSAAHEAKIVHRDIKPENIMLREADSLVKVLDFGLAKLTEKKTEAVDSESETQAQVNTSPGMVMGTVAYMSPEQARGKEIDARSDIWSLGVVIYEMLTQRTPFAAETMNDSIAAILTKEPAPPDENTPPELQRIIKKALQKKTNERYQTIKDFLLDVKNLKRELEFSEQLERSITPAFAKSATVSAAGLSRSLNIVQPPAISMRNDILPPAAIGKSLAGAVQKYKFASFAALAAFFITLAVGGYFAFFSARPIDSIAVLPFQNGSNDQGLDYLSDGLSESLIDRLTSLPQLKVIARSSAFKFRNQDDAQAAANALNVRAVVTGKVVRRGDNLTVRVELVDVGNNRQLWSETYNRKTDDTLELQDEIASEIAKRLNLKLSGTETQLVRRESVKPEAYELLLKGRFALRLYTPESMKKAVEFYQQAIKIEPDYALAFAELAYTYRLLGGSAILDPNEMNPKAEAAATKALELDKTLAVAHLALAEIKRDNWNWTAAEQEYKRAIESNPNLAEAREGYALYLSILGRHDPAVAEMRRARELDPLRLLTNISLGATFYNARRFDEASVALTKALELDGNAPITHAWLGIVNAGKGSYSEAVAAYRQAISFGDDTTATQCYFGYSLAKMGKRADALAILNRLQKTNDFVPPASLAILYAGLDERESALDALERAFAARDPQLQYLNVEPHYDSLRADSRFQNLVRRVGLSSAGG